MDRSKLKILSGFVIQSTLVSVFPPGQNEQGMRGSVCLSDWTLTKPRPKLSGRSRRGGAGCSPRASGAVLALGGDTSLDCDLFIAVEQSGMDILFPSS